MNSNLYFKKMMEDGRFATISENGKISVLMFFSICDDPEPFLENIDYEFLEHDPNGKVLVIEGLVTAKFKFAYVDAIQKYFCERFHNLEKAMWRRRRFPKDKIYTLWRRHQYAVKN